jgi:tetratricopeptide (TPR) repeat protein
LFSEAIECFDNAIKIDPTNKIALTNKGAALGNLGKNEEALECFNETLKIDPEDVNAIANKNILLEYLDSLEEDKD